VSSGEAKSEGQSLKSEAQRAFGPPGGPFGGLEPLHRYNPRKHWVLLRSDPLHCPLQSATRPLQPSAGDRRWEKGERGPGTLNSEHRKGLKDQDKGPKDHGPRDNETRGRSDDAGPLQGPKPKDQGTKGPKDQRTTAGERKSVLRCFGAPVRTAGEWAGRRNITSRKNRELLFGVSRC
jgi:hypothetical protein